MSAITVKACSVSDIESDQSFPELAAAYEAESSVGVFGAAKTDLKRYRDMESSGIPMRVLGVYDGAKLVGFAVLLWTVIPHYGAPAAITESLFVSQEARGAGAGIELLNALTVGAEELGAKALFVSAPAQSKLARAIPAFGFELKTSVFCKRIGNE